MQMNKIAAFTLLLDELVFRSDDWRRDPGNAETLQCGCELDRDTASAKVILEEGRKQLGAGSVPQMNPPGESVQAPAF
jgi:hypothetical protein